MSTQPEKSLADMFQAKKKDVRGNLEKRIS
jgi:hypothetical protein